MKMGKEQVLMEENTVEWVDFVTKTCVMLGRDGENKKFRKWQLSKESITKGDHFFDYNLWFRCFLISEYLKDDYDHVTLVCGLEGLGKSTIAIKMCAIISPSLHMTQICFNPDKFIQAIIDAQPGESIIIDEGALFLFSRESISKGNRNIVKLLSIVRQKNIHLVICIPDFWSVDNYVRRHRASTLIDVKTRGSYEGLNRSGMQIANDYAGKKKAIATIKNVKKHAWKGHWTKPFVEINDITEATYRELKKDNLGDVVGEIKGKEYVSINVWKKLQNVDFAPRTIRHYCHAKALIMENGEESCMMVGGLWKIHREAMMPKEKLKS